MGLETRMRIVMQILMPALFLACMAPCAAVDESIQVLCTTFPVYQFTRNITEGCSGIDVGLMLPSDLGCPHDYTLTPQDMTRLSKADVLVTNGLGLDDFFLDAVKRVNPGIPVIDASRGIDGVIRHADEGHEEHGHHGEHNHDTINAHLFASPRMAIGMVSNIAAALAEADPARKDCYAVKAAQYTEKLRKLDGAFRDLGKRLLRKRIVTQSAIFEYLARDMGLEIVAIVQPWPGHEPSASEMLDLVRLIREKKPAALFIEPQYTADISRATAREADIPVAELNPAATGPEKAPLDYYESVMGKNMKILTENLGVKKE